MAREVDVAVRSPLLSDVLAVALTQLGYAVLPPHMPQAVQDLLGDAGQLVERRGLYEADGLEDWQPCLLSLRLAPAATAAASALVAA